MFEQAFLYPPFSQPDVCAECIQYTACLLSNMVTTSRVKGVLDPVEYRRFSKDECDNTPTSYGAHP